MSNPPPQKGPFQGHAAPRDPRRRPRTTAAGPGRQGHVGEATRAPPPPRDVTTDVSAAARVAYDSSRSVTPVSRRAPSGYVEPAGGPRRSPSPPPSRALVAAPTRAAHRTRQVETSVSRDLVAASRELRAAAPARAQPAARAPPAPAAEPAALAAAARSMPLLEPNWRELGLADPELPECSDMDLAEIRRRMSEYAQRCTAMKAAREHYMSAMEIRTLQAARRPRYSPDAASDAESKRQRVGPTVTVTDTDDDMASYSDLPPSRPDTPIRTSYADQARKTPPPQPTDIPPAGRTQPPTTAPTRKPRYPPLIVENLPNWATHFKALKGLLGRAPNARPLGKGVKFSPADDQEYRHIQRYLTSLEKSENISWFSYSLPADRSLKVAIRGLPADTDPESIMEDLRGQGYDPEFVRPIRARKGRPGCIFLGIFRRTAGTIPDIYRVDEILCMPGVKIEAWRGKKGPSQCFRCQGFRHSSQNCHRQQACVRCGHPHSAFECPRPLAEPATCANCSGPHPANHVLCPVFRREARNKRAGTIATSRPTKTPVTTRKPSAAAPQGSNIRTPANEPRARGSAARRRRPRGRRGARPGQQPQDQPPRHDQRKAPPAKTSGGKKRDKDAVLVAIEVLQEVLQAVRDGRDPTPIVMRGLAGIISSAV